MSHSIATMVAREIFVLCLLGENILEGVDDVHDQIDRHLSMYLVKVRNRVNDC